MKWSHLNNYTKEKYVLKNCRILDFGRERILETGPLLGLDLLDG